MLKNPFIGRKKKEKVCRFNRCFFRRVSVNNKIPLVQIIRVPFAESIKKEETGILTGAVGLITDATRLRKLSFRKSRFSVICQRIS
jgi:hypothetical protein